MTAERFEGPWPQATYNGFAGGPFAEEPVSPPTAARGSADLSGRFGRLKPIILGGIAAAVVLGLGLGALMRPSHGEMGTRGDAEAGVTPRVAIQVNGVPPPPAAPRPAGRLEVLPTSMATAAAMVAPERRAASPADDDAVPTIALPKVPQLTEVAPLPTRIAVAPAPTARPMRDACAAARSRAEAIVCADPDLAAADRDLNRAYRRALRSGVSPDELRADQRDWLAEREEAATRSPRALAGVYERRIDELDQLAEDDDGPG